MKRTAGGLLAIIVATVACSGDGEGGADDAQATPNRFIEQATLICKEAAAGVEEKGLPLFGPGTQPTRAQLVLFVTDTMLPALREQVADLRELEPPASQRDGFDAFLGEADRALVALEDRVRDDPESLFKGGTNPFATANEKAAAIGLGACAGGP